MLTMPAAAVLSLFLVGMVLWLINGYIPIPAGRLKTVLNVVLGLIIVGIGLWLVNTYIPMAGIIKGILNIVVVIATCVGVLQAFGLWESVINMWRKIRHHRWSHPEHDQPPATERVATEKPVVEKACNRESCNRESSNRESREHASTHRESYPAKSFQRQTCHRESRSHGPFSHCYSEIAFRGRASAQSSPSNAIAIENSLGPE